MDEEDCRAYRRARVLRGSLDTFDVMPISLFTPPPYRTVSPITRSASYPELVRPFEILTFHLRALPEGPNSYRLHLQAHESGFWV